MPSNVVSALPYRPCVGIMLINSANLVFAGQRLKVHTEAWQMPQGGIDPGEKPLDAALREMKEEIGTDNAQLLCEHPNWLSYDLPEELIPQFWGGSYRGQTQKWFLFRFLGSDSEIDLQTAHPEFRSWQWLSADQLPDLIVPFKRDIYRQVVEDFRPYWNGSEKTT